MQCKLILFLSLMLRSISRYWMLPNYLILSSMRLAGAYQTLQCFPALGSGCVQRVITCSHPVYKRQWKPQFWRSDAYRASQFAQDLCCVSHRSALIIMSYILMVLEISSCYAYSCFLPFPPFLQRCYLWPTKRHQNLARQLLDKHILFTLIQTLEIQVLLFFKICRL